MFKGIGGKIKMLAEVICWTGIIASIGIGLIFLLISTKIEMRILGFIIAIIGSFISWINSFLLYGFGQLVENSDVLVGQGREETRMLSYICRLKSDKLS